MRLHMRHGPIRLLLLACFQSSSKRRRRVFTVTYASARDHETIRCLRPNPVGFEANYVRPTPQRAWDGGTLRWRNKDTTRLSAEWVPQARGYVLEIWIGAGLKEKHRGRR